MKKIFRILVVIFEILVLTQLPITNYQSPDLVWAQPPRVKYKERVLSPAMKGAPAIFEEKPEPEVKITLIPKKLSPHFNEFVVEAEILNEEITKVSFRLFGRISGLVKLQVREVDFSLEGLGEKKIFYRGYDLGCPYGGVKGVSIYFRVAKNWLTEKNVSAEKISLNYYTKGEVSTLPTEKVSEDENYVYYLSMSDRLGVSLIFAEK